jgi:NAD(P)-dependent dehydrogenase (short-subunit alcohol dehydrogenase family)
VTLAGRLAVVTGASRGIGATLAVALVTHGARVVRIARSLRAGGDARFVDVACDLTDPARVEQATAAILRDQGVPDLVVSNAGAFLLKPLEQTTPAELETQIGINLRAPYLVARAFLPAMRQAGRGLLINIGSLADHQGLAENSAYAASKYGLRGLHETLVAEYRGTGVRITLISPGATDTSAWDPVDFSRHPDLPTRPGMLRPQDVADAVLFVATRPERVQVDWLRMGTV